MPFSLMMTKHFVFLFFAFLYDCVTVPLVCLSNVLLSVQKRPKPFSSFNTCQLVQNTFINMYTVTLAHKRYYTIAYDIFERI